MTLSQTHLRRAFSDICRGYTVDKWNDKTVYLKHLTHFDQVDIDRVYDDELAATKRRGIPADADRMKELEGKGLWTKKDETDVARKRDYIKNLEKTKEKLMFPSQVEGHQKTIDVEVKILNDILSKRHRLIGLTAEHIADQRVQYEYIRLSFFNDAGLSEPMFTQDDINYLYEEESLALLMFYVDVVNRFGPDTLRRIAIAPFFTNYFYLCGEDLSTFFKKAICDLSIYQIHLLSNALYFKRLMSQIEDIPPEMRDDPEAIESLAKGRSARDTVLAKAGNGQRVGLFGAKDSDFKAMGLKNETAAINETAQKGYKSGMDAIKGGMSYDIK